MIEEKYETFEKLNGEKILCKKITLDDKIFYLKKYKDTIFMYSDITGSLIYCLSANSYQYAYEVLSHSFSNRDDLYLNLIDTEIKQINFGMIKEEYLEQHNKVTKIKINIKKNNFDSEYFHGILAYDIKNNFICLWGKIFHSEKTKEIIINNIENLELIQKEVLSSCAIATSDEIYSFCIEHIGQKYVIFSYSKERNILLINCYADILINDVVKNKIKKYIELLQKYVNLEKISKDISQNKITLGTDPEFEILNSENMNITPMEVKNCKKIGLDGCGRQLEIRPAFKYSPKDITNEISNIMKILNGKKISVNEGTEPLGAHIHIGIDTVWYNIDKENINQVLSNIYSCFIGSIFIETNNDLRRYHNYGNINDYRNQNHGIEYRSLPSYVFIDKKLTNLIFKIFYNITEYFINRIEHNEPIIFHRKPTLDEYKKIAGISFNELRILKNYATEKYNRNKNNILKYWVKPDKEKRIKIIWEGDFSDKVKKEIENYTQNLICHNNVTFKFIYGDKAGFCLTQRRVIKTNNVNDLNKYVCMKFNNSNGHMMEIKNEILAKINLINKLEKNDTIISTKSLFYLETV